MLEICVLASGSSGNCIFVRSATTRILIDAGISCRRVAGCLEQIGEKLEGVNAVCVTHEHGDHHRALAVLHRRTGVGLYANHGTVEALSLDIRMRDLPWNIFQTGVPFQIGDITIEPFPIPHDSYEPVGMVLRSGGAAAGIATDIGIPTAQLCERLKGCQVLVLESNHDEDMLRNSTRPWKLKQRISGRHGHLSNNQAAEILLQVAGKGLHTVLLAHLSNECNLPHLAENVVRRILGDNGHAQIKINMTYPDRISALIGCEECVEG